MPNVKAPNNRGLTTVGLVIAIVVIGVLAAICIPLITRRYARGNVGPVKDDLQRLVSAQESWFYQHSTYTKAIDSLKVLPSPGVTLVVVDATPSGWSASATHQSPVPVTCAVFYGKAAPVPPATAVGQVACK